MMIHETRNGRNAKYIRELWYLCVISHFLFPLLHHASFDEHKKAHLSKNKRWIHWLHYIVSKSNIFSFFVSRKMIFFFFLSSIVVHQQFRTFAFVHCCCLVSLCREESRNEYAHTICFFPYICMLDSIYTCIHVR